MKALAIVASGAACLSAYIAFTLWVDKRSAELARRPPILLEADLWVGIPPTEMAASRN